MESLQETHKLTDVLTAIIELSREGQEATDIDDQVVVNGKLYLPMSTLSDGKLYPDIRFGNRLEIMSRPLQDFWGTRADNKQPYRVVFDSYKAKTWKKAFAFAHRILTEELNKLKDALAKREEALRLAELDEENNESK